MKKLILSSVLILSLILSGCANTQPESSSLISIDDDYRTAYQVFVYSFCDSNGDGIGDLKGLESKLDYIGDKGLGFDRIWTLPIFPSPSYHKYDVTNYTDIDPEYGTLEDFDSLVSKCSERGIDLILDLPVNHTSSEHPWFVSARDYLKSLAPGAEPSSDENLYYDYYNFSREPQDGYTNIEGTSWYYESRFVSSMPDLNLSSDRVKNELEEILEFWLKRGVSGFRLDACTSFYTGDRTKSIEFLTWLNAKAKEIDPSCYLVGEVWADQASYALYYKSGIDSVFDFQFSGAEGIIARVVNGTAPASLYATAMESEEKLYASYNENYINAPFYTNHDMARSAGYYAWDDGTRTKIAGALNLLMGGCSYTYYGEELGMKGSGKDENKRAPMYWSDDPEYIGLCSGPEEMDRFEMKFPSLENQQNDPLSVFNYYKQAVRIRRAYPQIARGRTVAEASLCSDTACGFYKVSEKYGNILTVINLSENEKTFLLDGAGAEYTEISEQLNTSDEISSIEGTRLTVPAYGIVILEKKE